MSVEYPNLLPHWLILLTLNVIPQFTSMSHLSPLFVLVPRLPPAVDGLGDYGFYLAQQIYQDQGWQTHFLVGDPSWSGKSRGEWFQATAVAQRSTAALEAVLPSPPAVLLLHYVGHGYAPRGCPVWLVQALERWCAAGGRLVTMFHELYATEPLWSSVLFTSIPQKRLAVRLMRLSEICLTNCQNYATKICRFSRHQPQQVSTLPIFSNIGEVREPLPLSKRSLRLVIFGGKGTRLRVYQRSHRALAAVCETLKIQEILDIGPPLDQPLEFLTGIPIHALGIQSAQEISQVLGTAIAGFLNYPTAYLGKSGIFAAYCAHGVIPIVATDAVVQANGLADACTIGSQMGNLSWTWRRDRRLPMLPIPGIKLIILKHKPKSLRRVFSGYARCQIEAVDRSLMPFF